MPVNKEKPHKYNLVLPQDLWEQIVDVTDSENEHINDYLRRLVKKDLFLKAELKKPGVHLAFVDNQGHLIKFVQFV